MKTTQSRGTRSVSKSSSSTRKPAVRSKSRKPVAQTKNRRATGGRKATRTAARTTASRKTSRASSRSPAAIPSVKQLGRDVSREVVNSIKSVFPTSPVSQTSPSTRSASGHKSSASPKSARKSVGNVQKVRGAVRSARNAVTTGANQVAQQVNKMMNGAGTSQRRQKGRTTGHSTRPAAPIRTRSRKSAATRSGPGARPSVRPVMARSLRNSSNAASSRARRTA
ncbi:MAG: hypothetical protein H7222_07930 [Methylotenera sp.]|nr:hypothetical protein [Oligoflexia bacterium]